MSLTPTASLPKLSGVPAPPHRVPSQDRRRQLLEVAIDLFSRKGFSGTKTKDIAAAAGVSEAILFRHFATKEDLYHAILDTHEQRESSQWLDELRRLAERGDDLGFFRALVANLLETFRKDPAFHRLMFYAALEGHTFASLFHQRVGLPTFDFLQTYIAQRQKEGVFRRCDPRLAAIFALSVPIHYAMSRYVFSVKKMVFPHNDVVDEFANFIWNGLRKPASKTRKK